MTRAEQLAAAYPDVHPVTGERNTYFVDSKVKGGKRGPYLVRLDANRWAGWCSCAHHQYRLQPQIDRGALPGEAVRCDHLKRARAYHLDIIGPAIDRLAPPPRNGRVVRQYQLNTP